MSGQMTMNDYATAAVTTAIYPPEHAVMYPALGLAGETGEVCDKLKKIYRDHEGQLTDEHRTELAKELGDVLWYVAALARDLGVPLDQIAQGNLDKLASRKQRGKLGGSGDNR